jgi:ubiquinone/menaquinone biosynthesis C-methylase UbiE
MTSPDLPSPFVDAVTVRSLYARPDRLTARTTALKAAKVAGRSPPVVIAELASRHGPPEPRILEVGPGRGGVTKTLAASLTPRAVVAVDSSESMLDAVRERVASPVLQTMLGDFHALPLASESFDVAVAAFCLYHSARPGVVCAEVTRCVRGGGCIVLSTKGAASYEALDRLVASAGLDARADRRPSLYATFCTENMEAIAEPHVEIIEVITDENVFTFSEPAHALQYLLTSPKYGYSWPRHDEALAALAEVWPTGGVTTTSTVGYLVGRVR